jgi:predicted  nucleic acid-binding Zn-ribbon protein
MAKVCLALLSLLLCSSLSQAISSSSSAGRANPIRRVVTLLQGVAKKVEKEGEAEDKLYEKFFCYCKNGAATLEQSIAAAETKIPQLESSIKATAEKLEQLGSNIANMKTSRADAKTAIAEATGIRAKEAKEFAQFKSDADTNIAAMGKALVALEKGAGGSFLQTNAAQVLAKVSLNMDMSVGDRDLISSFLSTGASEAASGEIIGILKQLKETMEGDLAEGTKAENASIASFDSLVAAKEKEIATLTAAIETDITRNGEAGVELENLKEDLEDTTQALGEDKKFLADMDKNCAAKKAQAEEATKMRAQEQVAIAETITMLNSDDALELFKKTLPSASLLQIQFTARDMTTRAAAALGHHKDHRMDLISLSLKGRKVNFDKVIKMIDDMVGILGNEQKSDDSKKAFCEKEIDRTEDDIKILKQTQDDLSKASDDAKESIATLAEEIAALAAGVAALDKEVAEATAVRKEENAEFKDVLASNTAAVDLLGAAKNRLNKFYNPKLYKAPPARSMLQAAPDAPPATPDAYSKKGEESTGVIALLDNLIADLEKENQTMETEEKNAQEEYETFMADSKAKRADDSTSVAEKEGAKADAEANLEKLSEETRNTVAEEMGKGEELSALHKDCDFLLENFDVRKEARAGEVDSLKKAKAVLSGADFSLLQATVKVHRTLRGSSA